MHLERDILKGKFGNNKELKKEAREEIKEIKGKKKSACLCKALASKKK